MRTRRHGKGRRRGGGMFDTLAAKYNSLTQSAKSWWDTKKSGWFGTKKNVDTVNSQPSSSSAPVVSQPSSAAAAPPMMTKPVPMPTAPSNEFDLDQNNLMPASTDMPMENPQQQQQQPLQQVTYGGRRRRHKRRATRRRKHKGGNHIKAAPDWGSLAAHAQKYTSYASVTPQTWTGGRRRKRHRTRHRR